LGNSHHSNSHAVSISADHLATVHLAVILMDLVTKNVPLWVLFFLLPAQLEATFLLILNLNSMHMKMYKHVSEHVSNRPKQLA
jgi:hypothetical protein